MAENCHRKKISYRHGRNCHLKKNHIAMAENCHLKKKIISPWSRTAIGKKFHIGMAENCHRKKISYRHGRELPKEKNFISAWPRTAIAYSHSLVPRPILIKTRRLQRRSLRLPTRSKSTQTGHLYTTAQAGTDPRHFRM